MGAVFTSWLADDLLAEGLAIMLERAQIDSARMDPSEADLAAWDARQDRFFDAIEALPADPAHAGLKALAYAVIHSTDLGMPPKGDATETRLMRQLWLAAGCDIAGRACIGGEQ